MDQLATVFCRLVVAISREMSRATTLGLLSLAMLVVVVSKRYYKDKIFMLIFFLNNYHCNDKIDPICESLTTLNSQEKINQGVIADRLNLLKDVSGAFRPGVLTALMCVNGADKTTLMDALTGK